jgi:protocatechuate 3,4-dioxygenase beta subunit
LSCDANGNGCAAISGASGSTYTVTQADAGKTFRLAVTATNAAGSTTFTSKQTTAVPGGSANGCPAGTGTIQASDLAMPARLEVSHASISPSTVTLSTRSVTMHVKVTACNGRPVAGAAVFAVAIPYNQFADNEKLTGADGTIALTMSRERGFPARGRGQHLLAVFIRARKQGDPILGGVSSRRTVAFQVRLP